MAKSTTFGPALIEIRTALQLTQRQLSARIQTGANTVWRWEHTTTMPPLETRIRLLRQLKDAPFPLLEALADASNVSLDSLGIRPPAPPAPPPAAVAPAPPPAPPSPAPPPVPAIPATAQTTVDDALREAAEEIAVAPQVLRPVLSRMLDRFARGGVPIDAAARMVLGVPRAPAKRAT